MNYCMQSIPYCVSASHGAKTDRDIFPCLQYFVRLATLVFHIDIFCQMKIPMPLEIFVVVLAVKG